MSAQLEEEQQQRIAAAVGAVERRTAGEIVVVVAEQSDGYGTARAVAAATLTLLSAVLIHFALPALAARFWLLPEGAAEAAGIWILASEIPLALAFWIISGAPSILRRIAPNTWQEMAVDRDAQALFVQRGLTETRDRSGVLVYVSMLEHRVRILADKGIHSRIGVNGWQVHADKIAARCAEGQAEEGIAEAVEAIGNDLASHFPRSLDDINELPNAVQSGIDR